LLTDTELQFVAQFNDFEEVRQRLFVRLISRKGPNFRLDRLSYWDIPEIEKAAKPLLEFGFLTNASDSESDELLSLLVVPELRKLAKKEWKLTVKSTWNRDRLVEEIVTAHSQKRILKTLQAQMTIYQPQHHDIIHLMRLLFFGNLHQNLTDFVLQDLGIYQYEDYPWGQENRLFKTREDVDECFDLIECSRFVELLLFEEELEDAKTLGRTVKEKNGSLTGRNRRIADRMFNRLGQVCEKSQELESALEFYGYSQYPPARERATRILFKQERFPEAKILCQEILDSPKDETEIDFAPRFLNKIRKAMGESVPKEKRPKRRTVALSLERDLESNVETQVLEAYNAQGTKGHYGENSLWLTLFGLAFWDIIFAPIQGAFEHPFQHGPLDLHSAEFRQAREQLIVDRLAFLEADKGVLSHLLNIYDTKSGRANAFVSWLSWERETISEIISAVGGPKLAKICDRLSRDVRRYRRGFPDLFLFTDSGFELCEVKGPGDQLRPEQRSWLKYFDKVGISAFVARVEWIDIENTPN
ncbi:MAG: VRR-NUC domain-containing protein, partial [Planctomycetota bacterium]|nr:VRR-NUC domain-containing protein [Planctomycetota bacterium]